MIKAALAALQIAGHPVFLAQGVKAVVSTGDQFVGIGLVTHIPNHLVPIQVQGLVEGQGEFHHPQSGSQVTAAGAHHLKVTLADLASDLLQFSGAEPVQLIGMTQLAEMHAPTKQWRSM